MDVIGIGKGVVRNFILIVILLFYSSGLAQEIEFASSPNPVGSGARALGMGGAFIAIADDATAASWNPGGLIQLELPEVSIVGAGVLRSEDNTFPGHSEADGDHSTSDFNLNYLSAAYPFNVLDRNMVVALTYQHLYDFNRSWRFNYMYTQEDLVFDWDIDYEQDGGLSAVGLSYTIQVIPALSVGGTMNIWNDDIGNNSWTQDTYIIGPGYWTMANLQHTYHNIDEYAFEGVNFNMGFLWRFNESLTVGGVFKTPFTADVKHDTSLYDNIDWTGPMFYGNAFCAEENGSYDEEMDMPMSYGLGISYRFNDEFSMAFDVYRTHWENMIYTDHEGVSTSAISGVEESQSDINATVQVRTGAEYLIIKPKYLIPLRAGLFYDPAPSEGDSDDIFGLAIGSGIAWKQFVLDAGYQYRFGSDVGSAIFKSGEMSQDLQEHTFYASLIVHF